MAELSPSRRWIAALVTATVGVAVGWFGPIQILLPAQTAALAPGSKESLLALVTGIGAAASMIANPAWGVLSDRLRATRGTRTPVLVAGAVLGVVGLLTLATATSTPQMVLGWVAVQTGLNGPFAVLAALIADHVPEERRGLVGSLFGVAQLIGTVLGTGLAVLGGEGSWGYVAVAVAVVLLIVPILLLRTAPAITGAPPSTERVRLTEIRFGRPFVAAFGLRFLLNLVCALGLLYLYYFLSDRAQVDDPGTWVLVLTVVYVTVAGVIAGVAGARTDRTGHRRGTAAAAAVVLAVGAVALAVATSTPVVIAAVLLLGAGYGLFLAVDVAVVTSALPDPRTRATMLGVANVASSLPQVLAPVLAAPVVTSSGGYTLLYLGTAVIAVLALPVLPFIGRARRPEPATA